MYMERAWAGGSRVFSLWRGHAPSMYFTGAWLAWLKKKMLLLIFCPQRVHTDEGHRSDG